MRVTTQKAEQIMTIAGLFTHWTPEQIDAYVRPMVSWGYGENATITQVVVTPSGLDLKIQCDRLIIDYGPETIIREMAVSAGDNKEEESG